MPLELNFDKIVIGSSLEAVLCAFYNKFKILYTRSLTPDEYDIIEDYGLGPKRKETWEKHMFQLSMAGHVPFTDKIKHIRYVDRDKIKVITNEEGVYTVKYNELYIFDDHNFLDLPVNAKKSNKNIRILDWFRIDKGKVDHEKPIFNRTKLLNQIIIDKKQDSDICVISYTKDNKLNEFEEHVCRVKTESMLSSPDNKINLTHLRRDIISIDKELYDDFENIIFSYTEEKYMYELRRIKAKIDYMKYLRIKLGIANDRDE